MPLWPGSMSICLYGVKPNLNLSRTPLPGLAGTGGMTSRWGTRMANGPMSNVTMLTDRLSRELLLLLQDRHLGLEVRIHRACAWAEDHPAEWAKAVEKFQAAAAPAGGEGVVRALMPLFPVFGVQLRSEEENAAFWSAYIEVLADLAPAVLARGVSAYLAKPDSNFFPRPGPLRACCLAEPWAGYELLSLFREVEAYQLGRSRFQSGIDAYRRHLARHGAFGTKTEHITDA